MSIFSRATTLPVTFPRTITELNVDVALDDAVVTEVESSFRVNVAHRVFRRKVNSPENLRVPFDINVRVQDVFRIGLCCVHVFDVFSFLN